MNRITRSLIILLSLIFSQVRASYVSNQNPQSYTDSKIEIPCKGKKFLAASGELSLAEVKLLKNAKELLTIPYANVKGFTSFTDGFAAKTSSNVLLNTSRQLQLSLNTQVTLVY
jgi:hypothetical protein